jgi:Flp pilus assembly protein TadD
MMLLGPLRVRDAALAAATAALVVALPSLTNGFTYDDVWIVQQHPVVHAPGSPRDLLTSTFWPPTDGQGALWRPVTLAGFAAQWAVGGGKPLVFHVVTIGLSVVVSGLVAGVSGALFGPVVALVAGLLFAVHPVHVEVTATVVGQAELLAAAWYLVVLWAAWQASAGPGSPARWVVLAAMAAALGLGAKEHVITVPVAVMVVWAWRAARDGRTLAAVGRAQATLLLVVLAVVLGYVLIRRVILGDAVHAGGIATGLDPGSSVQRAIVMLPVSLRWLELLFVPVRLSADYSPQHLIPDPTFGALHAVALAVWVALGAAAWRLRARAPAVAFGTACFGVTIALVCNVIVPLEVLLAERLLFLPSVGWAIAAGGLVVAGGAVGPAARRGLIAGMGLVVMLFAARSMVRAPVWRSTETLFAQMLREAPNSFRVYWARGAAAFAAGDSIAGERALREAIRLNPDHPQPLDDLARVYLRSGRLGPAIPLLDRVVQLDSSRLGTALQLAVALSQMGRAADAGMVLDAMERLHGGGAGLQVVRADVLRRSGDFAGAFTAARRAVALDSTQWRLRLLAAETAWLAGACAEADTLLAAARRLGGAGGAQAADSLAARLANRNVACN